MVFITHFFGKSGAKPASDVVYKWTDATHWLLNLDGDITGVLLVLCRELPHSGCVLRLWAQASADQGWTHIGSVSNEAPSKTCEWPTTNAVESLNSQVCVELVVETEAAGQDTPDKPLWKIGDNVMYTQRDGTQIGATVVSVLNSVFPPSFGIKIDGSDDVRDTEGDRLAAISKYDKWACARQSSFRDP